MKKFWRALGTIAVGTCFLTGCGNGQTDGNSGIQAIDGSNKESQGQSNQAQDNQGQNNHGKTMLTLGTSDASWELTYAVDAYNARNGQYYVEIVNYVQEDQDYAAAEERLKLDLAASKGTDIIWMGSMVADELGYAGVLADLNTYLTPEEREKYLTNILEYAQTGDALYEIAATFMLGFIAGDSGKLGTETG